ncbi:MAG TPA: hypothetical protein VLA71_01950 [Algoriphagus sp.]|nr:hypothetical protein [Algoriphagus sp.]
MSEPLSGIEKGRKSICHTDGFSFACGQNWLFSDNYNKEKPLWGCEMVVFTLAQSLALK